jgi:TPR repeat protein
MTNLPSVFFRAGILLLAFGLAAPWAIGQPKTDAAVPQKKAAEKKSAKDPSKATGVAKQPLSKGQAARRYREGLDHQKARKDRAALNAFQEAAEAGNGLAQKRLAEIYDRGNSATKRDYETALHWYEKARAQGIELQKPQAPIKGR